MLYCHVLLTGQMEDSSFILINMVFVCIPFTLASRVYVPVHFLNPFKIILMWHPGTLQLGGCGGMMQLGDVVDYGRGPSFD